MRDNTTNHTPDLGSASTTCSWCGTNDLDDILLEGSDGQPIHVRCRHNEYQAQMGPGFSGPTPVITRGIHHYFIECACGYADITDTHPGAERRANDHIGVDPDQAEADHADDHIAGTTLGY